MTSNRVESLAGLQMAKLAYRFNFHFFPSFSFLFYVFQIFDWQEFQLAMLASHVFLFVSFFWLAEYLSNKKFNWHFHSIFWFYCEIEFHKELMMYFPSPKITPLIMAVYYFWCIFPCLSLQNLSVLLHQDIIKVFECGVLPAVLYQFPPSVFSVHVSLMYWDFWNLL